ncbi:hypothetical protein D9M72_311550 [compost metagenome]
MWNSASLLQGNWSASVKRPLIMSKRELRLRCSLRIRSSPATHSTSVHLNVAAKRPPTVRRSTFEAIGMGIELLGSGLRRRKLSITWSA